MNSSASEQMLGYLYQARYALFVLLHADKDESELAIEKLDDISFESTGSPLELLQTKHHINSLADLTNTSKDFWKTIRIWSKAILDDEFGSETILTLITTNSTPNSELSITKQLRYSENRNSEHIATELENIAKQSQNQELKSAFDTYLQLSPDQRIKLVKSIQLIDNSPDIQTVSERIKNKLLVLPSYRDPVFSRLEGWWFGRVIKHLVNNSNDINDKISKLEVILKLSDILEQFRPDSLPIDYADAELPEEPNIQTDQRQFVNQLRIIGLQNKQIEYAIKDYYRAFEQRSKWQRENLLGIDELKKYEVRLHEEWDRERLRRLPLTGEDEESMKAFGASLFNWAETSDLKIRERVTEPYVMRGSFHILANEDTPRVWWHPKFVEILQQKITPIQIDELQNITPHETKNLFNVAFNFHMLYKAIEGYHLQKNEGVPFALLFLILPITLHKETRDLLPRSINTKFHNWITNNSGVRIGFAERTKVFVKFTKEAVLFGLNNGYLTLRDDKFFVTTKMMKKTIHDSKYDRVEIGEIEKKSFNLGRWYAKAGTMSSIYVLWGIRP